MSKGIHHDDSDIVSLIQSQIISKDSSLKYHSFLAYKVYAMHPLQNLIRWPDDEIGKTADFGHMEGSAKDFVHINQFLFIRLCRWWSPHLS